MTRTLLVAAGLAFLVLLLPGAAPAADLSLDASELARLDLAAKLSESADPPARWFEPLSGPELVLQAAFLAVSLVDWGQTVNFTQHPLWPGQYELNPILGPHPSRAKVNALIPLGVLVNTALVWALPRPWRNVVQILSLGFEVFIVTQNASYGIRPVLPWR